MGNIFNIQTAQIFSFLNFQLMASDLIDAIHDMHAKKKFKKVSSKNAISLSEGLILWPSGGLSVYANFYQ